MYQKISTLKYYLAVEADKQVVFFFEKNDEGEWMAKTFTGYDEVISFPHLEAQLSLADIYKG